MAYKVPAQPIDGNYKAVIIADQADLTALSAAVLNGATATDLSCYFTGDGLAITVDEQVITDERLCSRQTFEQPGRVQYGVETTFIDNTNGPYETEYNEAVEALAPGTTGVLVTRRNLPFEDVFATGQKYNAYPFRTGAMREVPAEANSVTRSTSKLFITGDVVVGGTVVA
ncbi:hypothetical protein [Glutamicibacter sp. FBE19]|uniref:phage tail tube protein n=1 Tax=Glutamicibacter sp. FBE19 TaxID=2761534 RepID=UPI0018965746|nr:hypothetical protein [Glutamicibacter sp. FBE19]MBF6672445.1 hypothetical protein [Glutamicibacter sp. FBE19]